MNEEFTKEYRETIGVPRYQQELVRLKKADVIRKNFGDSLAQSTKAMDGAQKKLFAARREYAERFKPCAFQIEVMDNTEYEEGVMFIKTKWYKNMYRNRAFVCYHTNV